MARSLFRNPLRIQSADGTAIANTTTETIIFPNVTIPAEFMHNHRRLHLRASGKLSTTGTPTITFRLVWGGTSGTDIGVADALTMVTGLSNVIWTIDATIQCRSDGATGTVIVFGNVRVHTAAGTIVEQIFSVAGHDAPAAVTVDVFAAADLALSAQWSAADPSNTLTGMDYCLEAVN
jgi:hypothetical protein